MTSIRVYQNIPLSINKIITLDHQATHHLLNVLRIRSGSEIIVFNGDNNEYFATVDVIGKKLKASILKVQSANRESTLQITLVQCVSRGSHMDWSIQKAVELGVNTIIPVYSEYGGKVFDEYRTGKKMQHWQGVIVHACEQCNRSVLPRLEAICQLDKYLDLRDRHKSGYVLDPLATTSITEALAPASDVDVLVGPEGGLSEQEIKLATQSGLQPVNLGPRMLRTETAGVTAVSILQAELGDI